MQAYKKNNNWQNSSFVSFIVLFFQKFVFLPREKAQEKELGNATVIVVTKEICVMNVKMHTLKKVKMIHT